MCNNYLKQIKKLECEVHSPEIELNIDFKPNFSYYLNFEIKAWEGSPYSLKSRKTLYIPLNNSFASTGKENVFGDSSFFKNGRI